MALPSIDEARTIVLRHVRALEAEDVALEEARGRVLAADVAAAGDVPPFASSAMDGFAVESGTAGRTLRIAGESRAGTPAAAPLRPGEAIRISTGAAVPAGADAVVMVERTQEHPDGTVTVEADVEPGQNVRGAGEDMRAGTTVLHAGDRIGPAELGAAINAGATGLRCTRRPRVAIIATGDELRPPGTPLGPGEIHDSNALTLAALAEDAGAVVVVRTHTRDTPEETDAAVRSALERADVLICSGGVSVGPHDHVKPALVRAGVTEIFWRVALRPGKPTWFGVRDGQLVFGLPGNPVSAMVTFLLFARPALLGLQAADPRVPRGTATLAVAVARHPGRDEMVRVRIDRENRATPTGPQGSHVLTSMLGADALALIPRGDGEFAAGATVEVERLPGR